MEMVLHELTMNVEGALSMNAGKAGRVNGKTYLKKEKACVHQRMVECHYNEKGKLTGNVVCRECGAVIPDSVKVFR
jgi:hypothetical protein